MAEPAKLPPESPRRGSRDLKRVTVSLAIIALQRLADPEVRAQLAKHGRTLADNANQWRTERATRRSGGVPTTSEGIVPPFADRFGRRKLERRVDRLRSSVLALGEGRPELAASLDPVLGALEEVSSAIDVAAVLPLARRVRAHQKVDRVLDDLEAGLFQAALPELPR